MAVLIDVDDTGWRRVDDVEMLAERAVIATIEHQGCDRDSVEVSVLLTGDNEAARINAAWRNKSYATNVLSFPAASAGELPGDASRPLGDIVLAAGVVAREALEQKKPMDRHLSHLIVHGVLHLFGYDHATEADADRMERAEAAVLRVIGFPDPYDA